VVEAGAPGVVGPAGDHQVAFTYQDRALQLGLALSGLTLAGLGGIWWRRRLGSEPAGERWVNSRGRAADNGCAGKSGPAPF
jgi:hypothetical protein